MPIVPSSITARSETTYEYWQFFAQLLYFLVRSRHDVTTRAKEPFIPSTRQFLAIFDGIRHRGRPTTSTRRSSTMRALARKAGRRHLHGIRRLVPSMSSPRSMWSTPKLTRSHIADRSNVRYTRLLPAHPEGPSGQSRQANRSPESHSGQSFFQLEARWRGRQRRCRSGGNGP